MNRIKKFSGLLWMALSPIVIYLLVSTALTEIARHPVIDTKIQWGVFIVVFIPICFGFFLFGLFAWRGEYAHLPEDSSELEAD